MKKSSTVQPENKPVARRFRRRRFRFTWKKLLVTLCILFGLGVAGIAGVFAYYSHDLPNPRVLSTRKINQSTHILDRNGTNLYNIHGEQNRTLIPLDQINDFVKKAEIATEDATFYSHPGFSIRGIGRAVYDRFENQTTQGGSTITQQYVKNALLSRDQTVNRKIKELILAIEVEHTYTKDEILTGYLNEIPYGSNAYGIEAAAQTYFDKHAKDLTLAEAATLAAIPQSPTYYSPYGNHLSELFARKDYVLQRMVSVGFISQKEATEAKKASPSPEHPDFRRQDALLAPHFVFYVREKLADALGTDPQKVEQELDSGGYLVTTSLDLPTQKMAENIIAKMGAEAVKQYNASNAALVAVDPKTGEVLSMVGSIDYYGSDSGATNFANSPLQPGSSFKPFVYATAFGPTHTSAPATIVQDVPTDFGGGYRPNNFDLQFHGALTDREALARSLNIPAVKNAQIVGVKEILHTAQALGLNTLNRPESEYGLSIALGAGEVRPVEMAGAFAGFANGGMFNPIRPILSIEQNGKMVKDFRTVAAQKAVEPEVAYEITSILSDNKARTPTFGANSPLILKDRPVAAKTGTTENFRDAWTVGYTPSIAVAVWVGNNHPHQTMVNNTDGVVVAAPIWNRFMTQYLAGKPVEQFSRPAGIKEIAIDRFSGKLATEQTPLSAQIKDIFAAWQIPKEKDDYHIKPTIAFVSPANNAQVSGTFIIEANPGGPRPIKQVEFFVNDTSIAVRTQSPWTADYEAKNFGDGPQTLRIVATNDTDLTESAQITVSKAPPAPPPPSTTDPNNPTIPAPNPPSTPTPAPTTTPVPDANTAPDPVSNLSATNGHISTNRPIRLSWVNPTSPNLASVNIYQSTDANTLGARVQTIPATPGSTGSADIFANTLTVNQTYYFTVRSVSTGQVENQTPVKTSAKAQP